MFATEDFLPNETYASIPFDLMIYGHNHCDASWSFVQQYNLKENSTHKPYLDAIDNHEFLMPELWSEDEKMLIKMISPHDIGRHYSYFQFTCANRKHLGMMNLQDNEKVKKAFYLLVARGIHCGTYY